jgi:hypothetical protein
MHWRQAERDYFFDPLWNFYKDLSIFVSASDKGSVYRHFYIGEQKPGGSLKELTAIVEQDLKGSDIYVGEGDDKLGANIEFLLMQQLRVNIMTKILRTKENFDSHHQF